MDPGVLKKGAGALHKFTSSWGQPLQELSPEVNDAGEQLVDPMEVISSKSQRWAELWRCTEGPTRPEWWERLREAANQQDTELITEEAVLEGLKCFKAAIGVGADVINLRWWRQLPDGAAQMLADLLNMVESQLTWPTAVLLTVVQLLHKDAAADRPITLTQGLYRLWGRVRKCRIREWSTSRAGFWDRAVAGSAPLRAALLCQIKLEGASALGISWAEALWDLTKFYDHVGLEEVATVGLALEYPVVNLLLGLQIRLDLRTRCPRFSWSLSGGQGMCGERAQAACLIALPWTIRLGLAAWAVSCPLRSVSASSSFTAAPFGCHLKCVSMGEFSCVGKWVVRSFSDSIQHHASEEFR